MTAHIDPWIAASASTPKERRLLDFCRAKGLSVHRVHAEGKAVRISGPGVYVLAASFDTLSTEDVGDASTWNRRG